MNAFFRRVLFLLLLPVILCGLALASDGYDLRDANGIIAAFDSSGEVVRRTDMPTNLLLPDDRALITAGLHLADLPSLTAALEDFCS